MLQGARLGQHFATSDVRVRHLFSSDLQRAFKTAEAIRTAQPVASNASPLAETTKVVGLREQDFGFYEGKAFYERPRDGNKSGREAHQDEHNNDPGFVDVESRESMKARCDVFVDNHILSLLSSVAETDAVVVVAHGIILSHLWRCILRRFPARSVTVARGAVLDGRDLQLEHLGGWSNTGYLELEVMPRAASTLVIADVADIVPDISETTVGSVTALSASSTSEVEGPVFPPPKKDIVNSVTASSSSGANHVQPARQPLDMTLLVKAVNRLEHLKGLKKTRGGIGSLKHDEGQKTIESFFKKRKLG